MKRFWLVLLSLGLIAAFSTSAMAVDVKFSGEFYAAGLYLDKTTLVKDNVTGLKGHSFAYTPVYAPTIFALPAFGGTSSVYQQNLSTAFYFQRLRLNTTFVVHPGLFLTTRADIMERAWGAARSASMQTVTVGKSYNPITKVVSPGTSTNISAPLDMLSAGTAAENENIAIDLVYLTYVSPYGILSAGYIIDGAWGTVFGDNSLPTGKVTYMYLIGPVALGLQTGKNVENSITAKNSTATWTDRDHSFYTAFGRYKGKALEAGLLIKYQTLHQGRTGGVDPVFGAFPFNSKTEYVSALPYFKAQIGPVALQGEVIYTYGDVKYETESQATLNLFKYYENKWDLRQLSFWLDGVADFGVAYVGGTFAYMSGDDPGTPTKLEGNASGGLDWNPCLIMFNSDLTYWAGNITGYRTSPTATGGTVGSSLGSPMSNAWFFQLKGGVRPVDKLDIMASVSFANADKKPTANWRYNDYGWEVDLTATYKITNNLSYMLGAGYFFTGKYYKADLGQSYNAYCPVADPELQNNYMVLNKLTLTF